MAQVEVSLVIPAYNEAEVLEECVVTSMEVLSECTSSYEIIIVDDGSKDGTWNVVEKLHSEYPRVTGIRFTRNFGKESAILAGLKKARGMAVVVMDADTQHPPQLIPRMIEVWRSAGIPVVEAVKEERCEEPIIRRLGALLFYSTFRIITGMDLKNSTDYKLLDRKVVEAYISMPERCRFFRGLVQWLGYDRAVIHFTPGERRKGTSAWSLRRLFSFALDSLVSFSALPLRVVYVLGIVVLLAAVVLGALTLYLKLTGKSAQGFPTVVILQLFIGSSVMISLGVIGEYIARIYEEVKARPHYVVMKELE